MRKIQICLGILLLLSSLFAVYAQTQPEDKIFQEIKLLIFDKKWPEAQKKLEEFIQSFPQSPLLSQALYYQAKSFEEQEGKEKEALTAYKNYIQLKEKNKIFAEESEGSIIDLAYKLYQKGDKSYLKEIEERLLSPNKIIQYYAAIQLSYVKEKNVASKAIPVLKRIVEEEKDEGLRDRARIALLRISPGALAGVEEGKAEARVKLLKIRVINNRTGKVEVSINIPWSLADLALAAISEQDRDTLKRKGYDFDKIRKELTTIKGSIIEISDEGKTIKIWIE